MVCWLATVTTFLNDPFLQPICCATNAISAFYQMLRLLNHTKIFVYHRFRIFAAPTVSAHFYHFEEVGAGSPLLNRRHASRSPSPGLSPLGEERRDGERRRRLGAVLRRRRRASGRRARRECASPRASLHAASGGERESVSGAEDGAPTDPARSRVYPPTFPHVFTHDAPLTLNSRGLHHPPAAVAALSSSPTFSREGISLAPFSAARGRS